jgi:predicted 2-oxoglutarate/Fe(II)-dependent dioxygenase YbiX
VKKNIEDYAVVYPGFLSKDVCKQTLKELKKATWRQHTFYSPKNDKNFTRSGKHELSVSYAEKVSTRAAMMDASWKVISEYVLEDLKFPWYAGWNGFTPVRFNKYSLNTKMAEHCDHIHSLFDGKIRGIPILSIIGSLNENYTGGELIMFKDKEIKLKIGDILIFPSNFMYPHRVEPVKKGTRFSFVSWVY